MQSLQHITITSHHMMAAVLATLQHTKAQCSMKKWIAIGKRRIATNGTSSDEIS
jgi:hypothetical protein